MVMHKYFANWYSVANPEPKSEVLNARWVGIENLLGEMTAPVVFDLVRLFYDLPVKDAASVELFRNTFREVDSAFFMRDNELEIRVLAGATLVHVMDQDPGDLSDATALATACGAYQDLRPGMLLPDILSSARAYLSKEAVRVRAHREVPVVVKGAPITKEMVKSLTDAVTGETLITTPEVLTSTLEKLAAANGKLVDGVNKAITAIFKNSEIQLEETNVLWWLFGAHSRDQLRHMSEVGFPGACLVVGKELADLTVLLPGPKGAAAFLDKMLRNAKAVIPGTTKLFDAVNHASEDWKSEWVSSKDFSTVDDLCPVHLATARSVEMKAKSWAGAFESATGLNTRHAITPLNLSQQTYEECLLIRCIG